MAYGLDPDVIVTLPSGHTLEIVTSQNEEGPCIRITDASDHRLQIGRDESEPFRIVWALFDEAGTQREGDYLEESAEFRFENFKLKVSLGQDDNIDQITVVDPDEVNEYKGDTRVMTFDIATGGYQTQSMSPGEYGQWDNEQMDSAKKFDLTGG